MHACICIWIYRRIHDFVYLYVHVSLCMHCACMCASMCMISCLVCECAWTHIFSSLFVVCVLVCILVYKYLLAFEHVYISFCVRMLLVIYCLTTCVCYHFSWEICIYTYMFICVFCVVVAFLNVCLGVSICLCMCVHLHTSLREMIIWVLLHRKCMNFPVCISV